MGLTGKLSWPGLYPSPGHAGRPAPEPVAGYVGSGQQVGETQLHAGKTLPPWKDEHLQQYGDAGLERMAGGSKVSAAVEWVAQRPRTIRTPSPWDWAAGRLGNGHMLDT